MSDMTRKEAIKELKDLKQYCKDTFLQRTLNLYLNALNMAIASLETDEAYQLEYERTTKNDLGVDCIKCEYAPKTYEEYCISKKQPQSFCPNTYTEKAQYCGNYEKSQTESDDKP